MSKRFVLRFFFPMVLVPAASGFSLDHAATSPDDTHRRAPAMSLDSMKDVLEKLEDHARTDTVPGARFWHLVHSALATDDACALPLQRRLRRLVESLKGKPRDAYEASARGHARAELTAADDSHSTARLRRLVLSHPGLPETADAWERLAFVARQGARFQEAALYYGEATRLAPDRAGLWASLAYVEKNLGNDAAATKAAARYKALGGNIDLTTKLATIVADPRAHAGDFTPEYKAPFRAGAGGLSLMLLLHPGRFAEESIGALARWAPMLSAGDSHTCGIAGGKPLCWGDRYFGQTTPPPNLEDVSTISAGSGHTCALSKGVPVCWGNNRQKQSTPPKGLTGVTTITTGAYHTCAVDGSQRGRPVCWGQNDAGETKVPDGLENVTAISAGDSHSCAVSGGKVVCWGNDRKGQSTPPKDLDGVTSVSAGNDYSCAVARGKIVCWGSDYVGRTRPPENLKNVTAIATGDYHACALADGKVTCWGSDRQGVATPPTGLRGVTGLGVGTFHSCAMAAAGPVCWGDPAYRMQQIPPLPLPPLLESLDACPGGRAALLKE